MMWRPIPACTAITDIECATTSWSSRAIRSRFGGDRGAVPTERHRPCQVLCGPGNPCRVVGHGGASNVESRLQVNGENVQAAKLAGHSS
jgi:hypothetical protein